MTEQENAIQELETKIAFLENTVDELNSVVTNQSSEIQELKTAVRYLNSKLRECSISNVALPSEETPPPHY